MLGRVILRCLCYQRNITIQNMVSITKLSIAHGFGERGKNKMPLFCPCKGSKWGVWQKILVKSKGYRRKTGVPKGIRTPVTAVKGRCPRPLDDGDLGWFRA